MAQGMFSGPGVGEVNAQLDREFQQGLAGPQDGYPTFASNFGMAMRGFQGAMGMEDSRLEKAKKMEAAKKEISETVQNTGDAVQYYTKVAEVFRKYGLLDEAFNMERTVEQLKDKDEDRSIKKQDQQWRHEDRIEAMKLRAAKIPGSEDFATVLKAISSADPESEAKAWQYFISSNGDKNGALKLIKSADKGSWSDPYMTEGTDGKRILVQKNLKTNETKAIGGGGVNINNAPERAFDVGVSKEVTGQWGEEAKTFVTKRNTLSEQMAAVEGIKEIVKRNNYAQGSLADIKKMMLRASSTFGFASPKDVEALNDSDAFDSYIMQFVLPKMKMLGGSDSNEELKAIKNSTPNREWTPAAVEKALNVIEREYNLVEKKQAAYKEWLKTPKEKRKQELFDFNITQEEREAYYKEIGHTPINKITVPKAALDAYMKQNPNLTRAQAEEKLKAIKQKLLEGKK